VGATPGFSGVLQVQLWIFWCVASSTVVLGTKETKLGPSILQTLILDNIGKFIFCRSYFKEKF